MEYDPKQLELLVQKESSTLEGRLHNLSKKQKNIVNSQLSGLLDVHQWESATCGCYLVNAGNANLLIKYTPFNTPPKWSA